MLAELIKVLVVFALLKPCCRLEVLNDAVVVVLIRAVGEILVYVVLVKLVYVFLIIGLLRRRESAEVCKLHAVLVHVFIQSQLIKLRYLVRHSACVVVSGLRSRSDGIARRYSSRCRGRRSQGILRGSLSLAGVLLSVLAVKRIGLRVIAEIPPVYDLVEHALHLIIVPAAVFRPCGVVAEAAVIELLVQEAVYPVLVSVIICRRLRALEILWSKRIKIELAAARASRVSAVA